MRAGILPCGDLPMRVILMLCLAGSLCTACDVDDERDLCCDRVVMEYIYLSNGQDCFKQNIRSLRHFLFDKLERFVCEVPPGEDLQLQYLDGIELETGTYTMVTVGNAADATTLPTPNAGERLNNFKLHIAAADGGNADPLYYGIRRFNLLRETSAREQRFVTQMANVHCRLRVTVRWQNLPPAMTDKPHYRIQLENCAPTYHLDGAQGYSLGERRVPYSPCWDRTHRADLALNDLQLRTNFISLRYTDESLPTLRILYRNDDGDEAGQSEYLPATPPLDLKTAFNAWGYNPSSVESQEYKIIISIYIDGRVGMKIESEVGVADWVDGGNIG